MNIVFLVTGILCLIYFICIAFFVGHGTNFFFIWLLLGIGALLMSYLIKKGIWSAHLHVGIRRAATALLCLGILLFVTVEGFIISGFSMKAPKGLDYLVVLGAQMKKSGPSKALQYRLDAAIDYLQDNPDTKVIVSGGQGSDEHISEAQGMYEYLTEKGIAGERVLLEDRSANTVQNLSFSAEFMDIGKESVAVVSNNFHMFRAVAVAKKLGYKKVYGIAAKGEPFLQANNMMREFFGVTKDMLCRNM